MTLDRMCHNFAYVPIISRPKEEHATWGGADGYIQDLWESRPLRDHWGFEPGPDNTHIFVCGNPAMIENMVERLEGEGFREHKKKDPGQIHVERYW
jgi:ferredoxin--NADP+ reductase